MHLVSLASTGPYPKFGCDPMWSVLWLVRDVLWLQIMPILHSLAHFFCNCCTEHWSFLGGHDFTISLSTLVLFSLNDDWSTDWPIDSDSPAKRERTKPAQDLALVRSSDRAPESVSVGPLSSTKRLLPHGWNFLAACASAEPIQCLSDIMTITLWQNRPK